MRERPIIFNAAMVRALLDGSKTQTRRIIKVDVDFPVRIPDDPKINRFNLSGHDPMTLSNLLGICPYGKPGDRLWVRETFQGPLFSGEIEPPDSESPEYCKYAADGEGSPEFYDADDNLHRGWKPSIHMPRWASRITLEIVLVRVERLNDISEADAKAEGVMQLDADNFERPMEREKGGWNLCPRCYGTGLHCGIGANGGVMVDLDCQDCDTHAKLYRHLREAINGAGSWAANPWVWVIKFKRVAA